ncbi:hypothetical protein VP01_387g1 [Puccinia sorghi]|uniref:Uncharacterized protein n=1 Tax=Puccinia sorghi TaxID=27349 RepID=A0A0L6USV0_9BASI|nr:hypothetical protein VP01_387g1 [Puccinia sorghi]
MIVKCIEKKKKKHGLSGCCVFVVSVLFKQARFLVFLHGSIQPPRQPNNIIVGGFICAYVSQYWALRKHSTWFHKASLNFFTDFALDAGTSINALMVYALSLKGFEWWWNPSIDSVVSTNQPWWRFWRDRSSSSSSSSSSSDSSSSDSFLDKINSDPQHSEFTLITPSLLQLNQLQTTDNHHPPYDSFTSSDITPTLQRLLAFWNNTAQEHAISADLGLQLTNNNHPKTNNNHPKTNNNTHSSLPETDLSHPNHDSKPFRLPKIRKQPLNPLHKLLFKHDGKLFLLEESNSRSSTSQSVPNLQDPAAATPKNHHSPSTSIASSSAPPSPSTAPKLVVPQPSAWWLDISCPTSSDMHQLRKIFPLHPLTIEDILHQDTREKTETFHSLGYYLICFRGLDESSFKYTDDEEDEEEDEEEEITSEQDLNYPSPETAKLETNTTDKSTSLKARTLNSTKDGMLLSSLIRPRRNEREGVRRRRRRKTKKIIQVFEKNHTEPFQPQPPSTTLHPSHVRGTIPLKHNQNIPPTTQTHNDTNTNKVASLEGVGVGAVNMYLVVFRDGIISFHFSNLQKHIDRVKERIHSFSSNTGYVSPRKFFFSHSNESAPPSTKKKLNSLMDEFFPVLELIESETDWIEEYLLDSFGATRGQVEGRKGVRSGRRQFGGGGKNNSNNNNSSTNSSNTWPASQFSKTKTIGGDAGTTMGSRRIPQNHRSQMLNRITLNRRLVVSMARLLAQKHQTVEALRKRISDHDLSGLSLPRSSLCFPCAVSHKQTHAHTCRMALISFFFLFCMLRSHLGSFAGAFILRHATLECAFDQAQDVMIIRLYLITLIVLPMNTLIGLHSMNIHIPVNGDMITHRTSQGTPAPYNVFVIIIFGCLLLGILFVLFIAQVIFAQSSASFNRAFPKLFYFL